MSAPTPAPPVADPGAAAERGTLRVVEIFGPTLQGEGHLIGQPTVFVRLGGCDYRCAWCDTLYAVLPQHRPGWARMEPAEVVRAVAGLAPPPILITLSGGNPALQPCRPLLTLLHRQGYRVALETQGSVWPEWFADLDLLVVSPKPPSSGETPDLTLLRQHLSAARARFRDRLQVKIVIMDDADLDFAAQFRDLVPFSGLVLQVGNPYPPSALGIDTHPLDQSLADRLLARWRWGAEAVLARGWHEVRVLPQLHVLAWGTRRGV